jgi:hypothetical protein
MRKILSITVLGLACLSAAAFVFVAVTQLPYTVTKDSEGWGVLIFWCQTGPLLAGATLLFAVAPSALLFLKGGRTRRDKISLIIALLTLGAIVLTGLLIDPLRHLIIFEELKW